MKRGSGILLAVLSLPSKYGIGCFSQEAYRFIDFLKASGQKWWQILPLGHTGYGDSPYQTFSVFAGNPYFIDPEGLLKDSLLTENECHEAIINEKNVNYEKLYNKRYPLLKKAYGRFAENADYNKFCCEQKWLDYYALVMALKDIHEGKPWYEWDRSIRLREPDTLENCRQKLKAQTGFYKFIQYYFFKQWHDLKKYAASKGVGIIGDIPIYTALDSADVWVSPELFLLNRDGIPTAAAGCPPDGFSADGQLWGNPLYDWEQHRETEFRWWISRLEHCFKLYDTVRIDHFRGFDEYYSIPYGDMNAARGHWKKGPGKALFDAAEKTLGKKSYIAEDLGFMTETVKKLVKDCGFPNMKVLEFAFDSRDTGSRDDHLPHNYGKNCVAYTGTHDNQTLSSWLKSINKDELSSVKEYLCDKSIPTEKMNRPLIALIMRSRAKLCIIPMQDWLELDDSSRMNTPSTVGTNWRWRLSENDLTEKLCREIKKMSEIFGRC